MPGYYDHRATARDPTARVVVCGLCGWPLEWREKVSDWWHSLKSGVWIEFLYQRDRGRCWICGRHPRREDATLDHLRPKTHGGPVDPSNLRLACRGCNQARGDLPYTLTMEIVRLAAGTRTTRELLRSTLRDWRGPRC